MTNIDTPVNTEDRGATPPEILLASLASCLTAGVASVAQHRENQLRSAVYDMVTNPTSVAVEVG